MGEAVRCVALLVGLVGAAAFAPTALPIGTLAGAPALGGARSGRALPAGCPVASPRLASLPTGRRGGIAAGRAVTMAEGSVGKRVCIVGGGFGGLYTALNLAKLQRLQGQDKADVTLIDANDRFVFLPMLYELVTGELKDWEVAPVFTDLLEGTGVRFVHGKATARDTENKTLTVEVAPVAGGGEEVVPYDHLVIALGSQSTADRVEGAAEHAIPFSRVKDAERLRDRIDEILARGGPASAVVVGGGYSGVELACNLKDRFGDMADVSLVHRGDRCLEPAVDYNRDSGARRMASLGVRALMRTGVESVGQGTITLKGEDGELREEACDVCVWTAGVRASDQAEALGLETTDEGRVRVSPQLRVSGQQRVYCLGDMADCKDALSDRAGATAQVALAQADAVAWNIHADITGGVPVNFRYHALGEMLTLGSAAASLASPLFGFNAKGQLAHALRRGVYLVRMPTVRHKVKVGRSWARRLPGELLKQAAEGRRP